LIRMPVKHTGRISQRRTPSSGLLATQMPAPMTGISSGMGAPMPAATSEAKAIIIGHNKAARSGTAQLRRAAFSLPAGGVASSVALWFRDLCRGRGESWTRPIRPFIVSPRRRPPMKLGLINSAWVQSGKGTAYGIRMTREIGFDSIDIFTDPLDIDAKERRLIQRECERVGLPIISIACVAVGLIDFNP